LQLRVIIDSTKKYQYLSVTKVLDYTTVDREQPRNPLLTILLIRHTRQEHSQQPMPIHKIMIMYNNGGVRVDEIEYKFFSIEKIGATFPFLRNN
jgi:hypothetical protein